MARGLVLAQLSAQGKLDRPALALEPVMTTFRQQTTELRARAVPSKKVPELEFRLGTWDAAHRRFIGGVSREWYADVLHHIEFSKAWTAVLAPTETVDYFFKVGSETVRTSTSFEDTPDPSTEKPDRPVRLQMLPDGRWTTVLDAPACADVPLPKGPTHRIETTHIRKDRQAIKTFVAQLEEGRKFAGFDLRMSLCTEVPVAAESLPELVTTELVRIKQRKCFQVGPFMWMFTVVWDGKTHEDAERNHRFGESTKYEIELEVVDPEALFSCASEEEKALADAVGDLRAVGDMLCKVRDLVATHILNFEWIPVD